MSSVKFNSDGADGLAKSLRLLGSYRVRVGILGEKDKRTDDEEGNSDIGFKMEFGFTVPDGLFAGAIVPARSFLGMPLKARRKDILKAFGDKPTILGMLKKGQVKEVLGLLGVAAENVVHAAFATSGWGSWAPNSRATKIFKGSDKPLIDTSQLERSVVSKVVRKG